MSRALTASQAAVTPAVAESQEDPSGEAGGSKSSKKSKGRRGRHRRRRRSHSHSSSSSSQSSSGSSVDGGEETRGSAAITETEGPKVITAADDRFARVLDYNTYRLRNKRKTYGAKEAAKMGRTAKNMKHSFGGYPPFSGKEPLKVFSWLRKFTKACDDTGVSEGMALYAVSHFLSGDAETRYTRALPDSSSTSGGACITSYPEAINWFLETYAEPHTLALAQDKFSRATKEAEESVEAFGLRLRGLSECCGNIHSEGTMKQQLIQGLPEFLRTDAFVYNQPACTYQQLVTYTAGKFKAAKDVLEWQKSTAKTEDVGHKGVIVTRPPTPRPRLPIMALVNPPASSGPPRSNPTHAATPEATKGTPWTARRTANRGPIYCYICWEAGHMAHQCPKLSAGQRDGVLKARDAFMNSTRGNRKASDGEVYREQREITRHTRIAVVQALCDGIDQSDDEEEARWWVGKTADKSAHPPPPSGEA